MIEVTIKEVDGVRFYKNIRILEPDTIENGVGVHRIVDRTDPNLISSIKMLGLRKVGRDPAYRSDLYAQYPMPYYKFKATEFLLKIYWNIVRWLYDNARMFKEIPHSDPFSWKYLTLYVWYRSILWKIRN